MMAIEMGTIMENKRLGAGTSEGYVRYAERTKPRVLHDFQEGTRSNSRLEVLCSDEIIFRKFHRKSENEPRIIALVLRRGSRYILYIRAK